MERGIASNIRVSKAIIYSPKLMPPIMHMNVVIPMKDIPQTSIVKRAMTDTIITLA